MPPGVEISSQKIQGARRIVKGGRNYGNARFVRAKWPDAGMHEVETPRLVCIVQGRVNYQAGNYLLHCREGDFILIPPGMPHPADKNTLYLHTPKNSCQIWFMSLYRRGLQCWASPYDTADSAIENYLFLNGQTVQLFELFIKELQEEKNISLCNSLLFSFMTSLQREVLAERYLHPGPIVKNEPFTETKNEFIQKLGDYIGQHLNEHLTLEIVSRQFYMSRAQFVRRMRREADQTFVEFLTAYRIQEAKTLLRESEWTAQAIAKFLGFKSPAYFHHLFVRQTGCTPGEYRLKNRAD
jgi:AraC-like DNA-binding protein